MKQFYTYLHCKPDGTPFYVGKGCGGRSHEFFFSRRNQHHKNIVEKYRQENISVFIFYCDSEEQAFQDEMQQILQLQKDGYELSNKTLGGEGRSGSIVSEETKNKLRLARKKQNIWNKGRNDLPPSWNKGVCGKDSHAIGNKSRTGQKISEEEKLKKSISMKKYMDSRTEDQKNEWKEKLREANKGQVPWVKGKKNSPETIAKRVAATRATNIKNGKWKL